VLVEQNIKLTLDLADDVVIVNTGAVRVQRHGGRDAYERQGHRAASGGVLNVLTGEQQQ
jgi:ABC-type branched-subunit amino acid transport system ATPase component